MTVPQGLEIDIFNGATFPVYLGTPLQEVNLTLSMAGDLFAVNAYDCVLCSGEEYFDPSASTTYKQLDEEWPNGIPSFDGPYGSDEISFGGILSTTNTEFVTLTTGFDPSIAPRIRNGHFGVLLSATNTTSQSRHIFSQLLASDQLLNPVIGMRFDPADPKITIGALDPNDYEGEINWVPMETPDATWDYAGVIRIDGMKGRNGSYVPMGNGSTGVAANGGEGVLAGIDTLYRSVAIPNTYPYLTDSNLSGPQDTISIDPDYGLFSYLCNVTTPYVSLDATINGVDYMLDSAHNLLRKDGGSPEGYCDVAIANRSDAAQPSVVLGLPFLRSVYTAYRFPTPACPTPYIGFAFPKNANRTADQIAQTPSSTPADAAQCLALAAPTSTPAPASIVTQAQKALSGDAYGVYGDETAPPQRLIGVDAFPAIVWNFTELGG
ncbi:acid protease [Coniophora puteana RWD-64-598 SS2]|uniref:Acid protease n=1 Tax=Coniophora puteana (strain RWD-64-598) TaxID=741705 RepID=A0A5M3MRS6_CONPW|nr:acid protease [Coniophora puteana RWD-64-598 SS2]EIW81858.1 acid protease [Coniophora puteana RWD-64-598 SS2]